MASTVRFMSTAAVRGGFGKRRLWHSLQRTVINTNHESSGGQSSKYQPTMTCQHVHHRTVCTSATTSTRHAPPQHQQQEPDLAAQSTPSKIFGEDVPSFAKFLTNSSPLFEGELVGELVEEEVEETLPYLRPEVFRGDGRSVFLEVYGCQMNVSDAEIAWSILEGVGFTRTMDVNTADVALLVTCAIREGAETKVFGRLKELRSMKLKRKRKPGSRAGDGLKIGVLGCMAERLKSKLLEQEKSVDLVVGPDAYRDLPRLLANVSDTQTQINVQLSLDETYADINPVRLSPDSPSVFVSIMRGCDNMCSYCIVPFTRGRERSRDTTSILAEIKTLSESGVKEVTLLGQNVNSYRERGEGSDSATVTSRGFKSIYRPKEGGKRFAELLYEVAQVDPQMRVRFTSPHPKDFPDELIQVIRDVPNVCKSIHLPAQSGSTSVLESMRRGYTRESYLELVDHIRSIIPDVTLSTDMIVGFCGETDQDHIDSLDLMRAVQFDTAYLFAYSMRAKTHAHHRLNDDVEPAVKSQRLSEIIEVFNAGAEKANQARVGQSAVVLVEGTSRRSQDEMVGRSDGNTRVIVPRQQLLTPDGGFRFPEVGDFVSSTIMSGTSRTLRGTAEGFI